LFGRAREAQRLVAGAVGVLALARGHGPRVVEGRVRGRERGVLDVAGDEPLALLPVRPHPRLDPPALPPPPVLARLVVRDDRLVLAGVELDVEDVGRLLLAHAARDADGLARRELAVHRGRGDPYALLSAGLFKSMELAAVQQLTEDARHLCL